MKKSARMLLATIVCLRLVLCGGPVSAAPERPELTFAVLSDIHVTSGNEQARRKLERALQDLDQIDPAADALVINGDLGDGRPEDYEALSRIMARVPHPKALFYTIGNHEFYKAWYDGTGRWSYGTFPNGETEISSIRRFLQLTGEREVYYDRWLAGYHFIFLGTEHYLQSGPGYGETAALLSEAQLEWLRRKLAEKHAPNRPVFVFLHQPTNVALAETGNLSQQKLHAILSRYPEVMLFNGHTHYALGQPGTIRDGRYVTLNSASVYEPLNKNGEPAGEDASQGFYVQVYPGRVTVKGRDFASRQWMAEAQFLIRFPHKKAG
ncbi:metallophosphoesterase family protein [Paenibacillus hamazuiensis]|uniref:metallophosphoesterase family protein n=1 Tax=Paenibacillus hamazuiensis TaxID=2936508 RepID=UPI00200F58B0|nr:metallophosphoesterase [Paenibacillus hamazuiensis]